jgi:phospholipid/cholesterol/gamma-HCH transport system ATP-binding protein
MSDGECVIDIQGLRTQFGSHVVHDDLDMRIYRGQVVGLVGGSGTGKTVLLRQILMLDTPAAGSIRVFGQDVVAASSKEVAKLNERFGVLFQHGALFTSLTIRDNVAVPLREHTRLSRRCIDELAELKIALAGLPASAADQYPNELSGGMIKRAALARALALDPDLLFLDEPSAGLDPVSANSLDELILQLKDSLGLTVLMVTHDLDSLWRTTDRVAFLGNKKVIGYDTIAALSQTEHPLIQAFFNGPRGRAARTTQEKSWNQK